MIQSDAPSLFERPVHHEPDPVIPPRDTIAGVGLRHQRDGKWIVVVVWAILFLVILVRVLLSPLHNSVVPIFTTASQRWLAGTNLYAGNGGFDSFRYSPLVAILLVPFSILPEGLGGIIWRLANGAIFLGALAWWLRAACPCALSRRQRSVLLLLILPLSAGSLNNGQCNPLVIGLLLAAMASVATERWNLAGCLVALACFFKLYPLAIGLLLAASYPRRFAPRFALALALGFLLPFFLQRPGCVWDQYTNWVHQLLSYDRCAMPLRLQYSDLRLLCHVWLWPIGPKTYLAAQLLTAAGSAFLCVLAQFKSWTCRRQLTLLLGMGCCWMLLLGPATESCTHILLAPSLCWALLESGRRREAHGLALLWLLSYGLLVAGAISCWFPRGAILHDLAIQPLAVLLVFMGLVLQACRQLWQSRKQAEAMSLEPHSTPTIIMSRQILRI